MSNSWLFQYLLYWLGSNWTTISADEIFQIQNLLSYSLIYTSLLESRLRYGILLRGFTTQANIQRYFICKRELLIRINVRILQDIGVLKSYFKLLQTVTLPSIYIYDLLIFYRFKLKNILTGVDVLTMIQGIDKPHAE